MSSFFTAVVRIFTFLLKIFFSSSTAILFYFDRLDKKTQQSNFDAWKNETYTEDSDEAYNFVYVQEIRFVRTCVVNGSARLINMRLEAY